MSIPLDMIVDEWKLRLKDETCHTDTYWNQLFEKTISSGDPKYLLVTKMVKAALYGSVDVERIFKIYAF